MKKLHKLIILIMSLLFVAACGSSGQATPKPHRCNTVNMGMSHFTININNGVTQYIPASIDDIIPTKEALIASLQEKGYEIEEFDAALGLDIPAQRVLARNGELFVDITYGLTVEQAKQAVLHYDDAYPLYYLAAQNEAYAYVISDRQAFDDAGFTSLANIGIQYGRCENCTTSLRELWEMFGD